MLQLDRRKGESIRIGDDIVITFMGFRKRGVARIGIQAPRSVTILRTELYERNQELADLEEITRRAF